MIIMVTLNQRLIVVIHIVGEIMEIKISCCWTYQIASLAEGMNVGLVSFVRQNWSRECGAADCSEH